MRFHPVPEKVIASFYLIFSNSLSSFAKNGGVPDNRIYIRIPTLYMSDFLTYSPSIASGSRNITLFIEFLS